MIFSTNEQKIKNIFSKLNKLKVFVIGDAMLDNYWMGAIDRISPEAPVPIISMNEKKSRPGGAANVALNCKSLGAEVFLLTVIGDDKNGKELIKQLNQNKICTDYLIQNKERITTTKTRVIAKNQQIFRLDEETTDELSLKIEHQFIDICLKAIQIEKPDMVIFEDYNKGVLKENVIEKIIVHCKNLGVLTAVDPKKSNFLSYKNVTIFKPNLKEVKEALNITLDKITIPSLKEIHTKLYKELQQEVTIITLSEYGVFAQQAKKSFLYPSHRRKIADVSGAGDTVIAVASMIYCITKDIELSTKISNLAGGLVCEEVGVVPINKQRLLQEAILLIK